MSKQIFVFLLGPSSFEAFFAFKSKLFESLNQKGFQLKARGKTCFLWIPLPSIYHRLMFDPAKHQGLEKSNWVVFEFTHTTHKRNGK